MQIGKKGGALTWEHLLCQTNICMANTYLNLNGEQWFKNSDLFKKYVDTLQVLFDFGLVSYSAEIKQKKSPY